MTPPETKPERVVGWALGGWFLVHLLLLGDSGAALLPALAILLAGLVLRGLRVFLPPIGEGFILFAVVVFAVAVPKPALAVYGALGALFGAVLLLRPLSTLRGLWGLFCAISVLAVVALQENGNVNTVFLIIDVAVLMLLAQHLHTPPEAEVKLWEAVARSLRIILPTALVVTLAFWIFPALSTRTGGALAGFIGGDVLNPGETSELLTSRQVAFVAAFPASGALPSWRDLYWRGQVLEKDEGLRWSRDPAWINSGPPPKPPSVALPTWRYSQHLGTDRVLAALDRAVEIDAARGEQKVTAVQTAASVFSVLGSVAMDLDIASTSAPADDPPRMSVASGSLGVPEKTDPRLSALVSSLLPPDRPLSRNLAALGEFFGNGSFAYTLRPGQMSSGDVAGFLFERRKGFCQHYAAAAGDMLRRAGIPSRLVTGFRGGTWNPWLRTVTVRDSDAHAWVEAWDAAAGHWVRFDPTSFIAPDLSAQMELNMEPARWSWPRLATAYVSTRLSQAGDFLERGFGHLPDLWPLLLLAAAAIAAAFLWRRRDRHPPDIAALCLARLEKTAASTGRARNPGETPLAWLARLGTGEDFATNYELWVYSADGRQATTATALKASARKLAKHWKSSPPQKPGRAV